MKGTLAFGPSEEVGGGAGLGTISLNMTTGVRALAVLGNEVHLQNTTITLKLFDDDASAPASFLPATSRRSS